MAKLIKKKRVKSSRLKKAKPKSTAVAVVDSQVVQQPQNSTPLSLADSKQVMEFGKQLNAYIIANGLSVKIEDKDYPLCGAWKFAGISFGLTAIPVRLIAKHKEGQYVTFLYVKKKFEGTRKNGTKYSYEKEIPIFSGFSNHKEVIDDIRSRNTITKETTKPYYSYECEVEVSRISDGHVVQRGTSVCSNMESMKSGFDEYAVMGQAQTRTISRALRNLLDFVLNAAGMESTPAEEMEQFSENEKGGAPSQPQGTAAKPNASDVLFEKLKVRALKGEKILDEALMKVNMTDAQIEALRIIEENQVQ